MSGNLSLVNLVFVGDNFPVSSMSASDFEFRGRRFKEQVRLGPVLQATSREVQLTALPDRFQITITTPDDLQKQTEGIFEVVKAFREFVGSRTINAVGHNAQARYASTEQAQAVIRDLVNKDKAADLLGVGVPPEAALTLASKLGSEDIFRLNLAAQIGEMPNQVLGMEFNFEFNKALGDLDLDFAVAELPTSLERAATIVDAINAKYGQGAIA